MKYNFLFLLLLPITLIAQTADSQLDQVSPEVKPAIAKTEVQEPTTTKTSLDLKKKMPHTLQKQLGVNKMSKTQLAALETWMLDWKEEQTEVADPAQAPKPDDNQLVAVLGEGHLVKLGSGEVWSISPNAWIYTYYWKAGDKLSVSKGNDLLFPYSITNHNYDQNVAAKKAPKEVQESLKTQYAISSISDNGEFIYLNDGTKWSVEPSVRYMVQGWSKGNSAFILKMKNSVGQPFQLVNGQTTRSVFVKPVKVQKTKPVSKNDNQNTPSKPQS